MTDVPCPRCGSPTREGPLPPGFVLVAQDRFVALGRFAETCLACPRCIAVGLPLDLLPRGVGPRVGRIVWLDRLQGGAA